MTARQDADALTQSLQKLHAGLPAQQQRALEGLLGAAQRGATQAGAATADVVGYMATTKQQGFSGADWAGITQLAQTILGQQQKQQQG